MADGTNNVVENWEDLNEDEIFEQSKAVSESKNTSAKFKGPIVLQGEDSVRSQYLPPEPSVKILKRPSKEERLSIAAAECLNGSRPMKTLRQREAEYAEARLRIMGNSSAPDEELNNWSSSFDAPQPPPPTATYRLLRPPLNDTPGQDIIRSPRGPTDAPGFAIRR